MNVLTVSIVIGLVAIGMIGVAGRRATKLVSGPSAAQAWRCGDGGPMTLAVKGFT